MTINPWSPFEDVQALHKAYLASQAEVQAQAGMIAELQAFKDQFPDGRGEGGRMKPKTVQQNEWERLSIQKEWERLSTDRSGLRNKIITRRQFNRIWRIAEGMRAVATLKAQGRLGV